MSLIKSRRSSLSDKIDAQAKKEEEAGKKKSVPTGKKSKGRGK